MKKEKNDHLLKVGVSRSKPYAETNPARLAYLLDLYGLTCQDILAFLNKNRKKPLIESDILGDTVKWSVLKQIDKEFFDRGLAFYIDSSDPPRDKQASIFFRKPVFSNLTYQDRFRVTQLERDWQYLDMLMRLSGYTLERKLEKYTITSDPKTVAVTIRSMLRVATFEKSNDKTFLKNLIQACSTQSILIYEFIERHNTKQKSSFDGLFIAPQFIAIKRNQHAFKREIFTLAHELGHYLLNHESVDTVFEMHPNTAEIERWCNVFAVYFLLGDSGCDALASVDTKTLTIETESIRLLSQQYHISRLALFTHLALDNKLPWGQYHALKSELETAYKNQAIARKKATKSNPKPGFRQPKPIYSQLEQSIFRTAFISGTIEEIDLMTWFKPDKKSIKNGFFEQFLYESPK